MTTKYFIAETKFFHLFFSSAIFGDKIFHRQNLFFFFFNFVIFSDEIFCRQNQFF